MEADISTLLETGHFYFALTCGLWGEFPLSLFILSTNDKSVWLNEDTSRRGQQAAHNREFNLQY